MPRKLFERIDPEEKGFTLIELLVVILIIGLLAAIAVPAFLSQRGKAQDSEAKSAVQAAVLAAKTHFTERQSYIGVTETDLQEIEPSLKDGVAGATLNVSVLGVRRITLRVTSQTTGWFDTRLNESTGLSSRNCGPLARRGRGGCPKAGIW